MTLPASHPAMSPTIIQVRNPMFPPCLLLYKQVAFGLLRPLTCLTTHHQLDHRVSAGELSELAEVALVAEGRGISTWPGCHYLGKRRARFPSARLRGGRSLSTGPIRVSSHAQRCFGYPSPRGQHPASVLV